MNAQHPQIHAFLAGDVGDFISYLATAMGSTDYVSTSTRDRIRTLQRELAGQHFINEAVTMPDRAYLIYRMLNAYENDSSEPIDIPQLQPLSVAEGDQLAAKLQRGHRLQQLTSSGVNYAASMMRYVYAAYENQGVITLALMTTPPRAKALSMLNGQMVPSAFATVALPNEYNNYSAEHTSEFWNDLFEYYIDNSFTIDSAHKAALDMFTPMQDLRVMSYYLISLGIIYQMTYPNHQLHARLRVAIRRTKEQETLVSWISLPRAVSGQSTFNITSYAQDARRLASDIMNECILACNFHSEEYDDEEGSMLLVTSITLLMTQGNQLALVQQGILPPLLANMHPLPSATSLVNTLRTVVNNLFVNSPEKELDHLSIKLVDTPRMGLCMFDCLFTMSMISQGRIEIPDKKTSTPARMRKLQQKNYEALSEYATLLGEMEQFYRDSSVKDCIIDYLKSVDRTMSCVNLCLAHKMTSNPRAAFFKVRLNSTESDLDYAYVPTHEQGHEDLIILLYRSHAMISSRSRMNDYFKSRTPRTRIRDSMASSRAYVCKKIDSIPPSSKDVQESSIRYPYTKDGHTLSHSGAIWMSFDIETGECNTCKNLKGEKAQHAVVLSCARTLTINDTFVGFQCPLREEGCVSKFLDHLFNTYYSEEKNATEIYIPAFNFSGFDAMFILQALLSRHVRNFTFIPKGHSSIMSIRWGNICFFDMMRIYRGSLDSVFTSFFKDPLLHLDHPEGSLPANKKYACFPYALLSEDFWETTQPRDILRENWIWKGKRAQACSDDQIGAINFEWWMTEFPDTGEMIDVKQMCIDYCNSDTWLLLFICMRHLKKAIGVRNSIYYNAEGSITVASMGWNVYETCYAHNALGAAQLIANDPTKTSGFRVKINDTYVKFTIGEIMKFSIFGGFVSNYSRICGQTHDRNDFPDGYVTALDINSSYPHQGRHEMPTSYREVVILPPYSPQAFVSTDLYCVTVICPTTLYCPPCPVRMHGRTVRPSTVPYAYVGSDKKIALNIIWGVELNVWSKIRGVQIVVYAQWKFNAGYPMQTFFETFYKQRLLAKGIDPVTYGPSPTTKNKLEEGFGKSLLNNTFGKTLQRAHSTTTIIHSVEQIMDIPHDQIVNIGTVHVGPEEFCVLERFDPDKPSLDNFSHAGSWILASARGQLFSVMLHLEQEFGEEVVTCVAGDTDSLFIHVKQKSAALEAYLQSLCHDCELGKWKEEFRGTTITSLGPKMYCMYPTPPNEDGFQDGKCKKGSKGVPIHAMKNEFFYQLATSKVEHVHIPLTTLFDSSFSGIYSKTTSMSRRIRMDNPTRIWNADAHVRSLPHATIEAFSQSYLPLYVPDQNVFSC